MSEEETTPLGDGPKIWGEEPRNVGLIFGGLVPKSGRSRVSHVNGSVW